MKTGFAVIICLFIQQNAVSGENLPELLKNAQTQTDEFHSVITSVLLKFRIEMSDILTGIVNESLSNVLKSLESSQLNNITSDESERIGKQISFCSAQADNDIQTAIKQFFFVLNPIHDESFAVLNTVVEQIIEWDNTSDPSTIADKAHKVLEAKHKDFVAHAVPSLDDELRKFKSILFLVPASNKEQSAIDTVSVFLDRWPKLGPLSI